MSSNNNTWNPSSSLLLGLSDKDKELLTKAYSYAKPLVERITELLTREVHKSIEETDQVSKYQDPNWPLVQSYISGQRAAYKHIIKLLKNKER